MPDTRTSVPLVTAVTSLSVRLFGSPIFRVDGEPIRPLRTRKGYALFALLALRHGRAVERDFVAETLWPDSGPEQALSGLRRTLTDLRDALGPAASCITASTGRSLRLNLSPEAVDVLHFDSLIAGDTGDAPAITEVERWRRAVALYRGPLLEGIPDEWALPERRRRDTAVCGALVALAKRAEENEALPQAIDYLHRAMAIDPWNETLCRTLMRVQHASGNVAALADTYRQLCVTLRRSLDARPSEETTALFRQLQEKPTSLAPASLTPASLPFREPSSGTLPIGLTSFIGREETVKTLSEYFPQTRLLTLTGPGGVGKSRLAVEVARRRNGFPDGVWFVDLSPVTEGERIPAALIRALSLAGDPGNPDPLSVLTAFLMPRRLLLVLDNAEHLVGTLAPLAEELLAVCPGLSLLVTGRQPLHLPGESLFPVSPLEIDSEAVRLFAVRAAQTRPGFTLTEANTAIVAEICRRLDGIPLAIELAAARIDTMPLTCIADHLLNVPDDANGEAPSARRRQKTLRATLDWSYRLLGVAERMLLRRLTIFATPAGIDAIHSVCAEPSQESWQTLGLLADLVEKSLVRFECDAYRLPETVRQYAREHLMSSGEQGELAARHRAWFLIKAEEAGKHWQGPDTAEWGKRFDDNEEDFRLALTGCPPEEGEVGVRLTLALVPYWLLRSALSEGRSRLRDTAERFAERLKHQPEQHMHLLNGLGTFAYRQGDCAEAEVVLTAKLALCQARSDTANTAHTLGNLGNIAYYRGDSETAAVRFSECLALYRQLSDTQGIATALMNLGNIATVREEYATAARLLSESLTLQRSRNNPQGIANVLHNLGLVALRQENIRQADALLTECLTLRRRMNHRQGIAHTLVYLQEIAIRRGEAEIGSLSEAWQILMEVGDRLGQSEALRVAAMRLQGRGEPEKAVECYAAMAARRASVGMPALPAAEEEAIARVRSVLGEANVAAYWQIGQSIEPSELMEGAFRAR